VAKIEKNRLLVHLFKGLFFIHNIFIYFVVLRNTVKILFAAKVSQQIVARITVYSFYSQKAIYNILKTKTITKKCS